MKKVLAVSRHIIYSEIRKVVRARGAQTALSSSTSSKHYLTNNELRKILEELDFGKIRRGVFTLYGLGDETEYAPRSLLKAYYTYMSDRHFMEAVWQAR